VRHRTSTAAAFLSLAALSGCGAEVSKVASVAESTRSATEHLGARAAQRNAAREAQISEEAEPMRQAEAIAFGERYYLEPGAQGWTVMDRTTNTPVSTETGAMENLPLQDAEKAVDELRDEVEPRTPER
jgi:hypothetical protein